MPGVGDEAYAPAPPLNEVLLRVDKRLIFDYGIPAKHEQRKPNQDEMIALLKDIYAAVG